MRRRVGSEWQWALPRDSMAMLKKEIEAAQDEFFGHMRTMPTVISSEPVEHLIQKFSAGTTPSRAALHLARAAFALGHRDTALALAEHGLAIAGERATALIYDLRAVRQAAM